MSWLGRLFGRTRLERDLDKELQFHLDAAVADLVRGGMTREAAIRRARIEIGGLEQVKEETRDARGTRWVEDLVADTRYALRGMVRSPAFTAAAVLTLAVGIGANTAVWSIVEALMLRSLPVDRPEQLRAVRRAGNEDGVYRVSYPLFRNLAASLPDSTKLAAMSPVTRMYASVDENPEPVPGQLVSGEWFSLLGVKPAVGRLISYEDSKVLGGHPVVVLSNAFWRTRFGADRGIVGKTLRVNGLPLTVIGVAGEDFVSLTVGQPVSLWVPVLEQYALRYRGNASSNNADTEQPWPTQNGISWLTLVSRVSDGTAANIEQRLDRVFRADVKEETQGQDSAAIAYALREHMVLEDMRRGFSPLRDAYQDPLKLLLVSVGMVLLIACGNLAGLLLARSSARSHEMSVRVSLGAAQGRLVRQVLTESLTLAAIGGALSLLVAKWGSTALLHAASSTSRAIPLDANLGWRVLLFAFGVSILTGILFGLGPALRIARADLYEAFRSGGRVHGSGGSHRLPLGRVLVVSQIALSLVLVTSAGLFVRTLQNLMSIDTGYQPDRIVNALIDVRAAGYTPQELPALHQRLLEAVKAVPGVKSASLSLSGPASGSNRISGFTIPGRELTPPERQAQVNFVSPEFFETVGISLLKGRLFTTADVGQQVNVAIVSRTAALKFFGTEDAIGKRFGFSTPPEMEVIGVVADARVNSIKQAPGRLVYFPLAQGPTEYINSIQARVSGPADAVIGSIRNATAAVDRKMPLREVVTIKELLERGLISERLVARLAGTFGILALLLAGIGLYGVIGFSVSRRTNEMGVRLALGASPAGVSWLVMKESLSTIAAGLVIGLALWFPLLGLTQKLVYGVQPHDIVTVATAIVLMMVVGAVGAFLPALRASRVDPTEAIRSQ
jgi:predicted permease